MDAFDVAERVGDEEPRRAVVDMLILGARYEDYRRLESANDLGQLLREVLASILDGRHEDLGGRGPGEPRVSRAECQVVVRPVGRHHLVESAVGKAEEGKRPGAVSQVAKGGAGFVLALPSVRSVVAGREDLAVPAFSLHAGGIALA